MQYTVSSHIFRAFLLAFTIKDQPCDPEMLLCAARPKVTPRITGQGLRSAPQHVAVTSLRRNGVQ